MYLTDFFIRTSLGMINHSLLLSPPLSFGYVVTQLLLCDKKRSGVNARRSFQFFFLIFFFVFNKNQNSISQSLITQWLFWMSNHNCRGIEGVWGEERRGLVIESRKIIFFSFLKKLLKFKRVFNYSLEFFFLFFPRHCNLLTDFYFKALI